MYAFCILNAMLRTESKIPHQYQIKFRSNKWWTQNMANLLRGLYLQPAEKSVIQHGKAA